MDAVFAAVDISTVMVNGQVPETGLPEASFDGVAPVAQIAASR